MSLAISFYCSIYKNELLFVLAVLKMDSIVLSYLRQLVPDGTVQPVSLSQSSDQPHQSPRVPKFEKERMRQKSIKTPAYLCPITKKLNRFPFVLSRFRHFSS